MKVVDVIEREESIVIKIAAWSVNKDEVEVIDKLSKEHPLIEIEQLSAEILNKGFYSVTLILLNVQSENLIAEVLDD